MKNWLFLLVFGLTVVFVGNVFAYNDPGYPYKTTSGCVASCYPENKVGYQYGFCQNNCTSYVAYMLNKFYGVAFNNNYGGVRWGNGGNWGNVASSIGIKVDKFPLPGDVAYWKYNWTGDPANNKDNYGHVAVVEKVYYGSNGNPTHVDVTEYNYKYECGFGERLKIPIGDISGFIHILAYNEGVEGMFYLDCYEMSSLCPFKQTKDEWKNILKKVWENYRCTDCNSIYSDNQISSIMQLVGGFGGGGSPPSSQSPADITIRSFEIKQPNINNYQHSIGVTMEYGSSISIVGELKVKNKGETEAKNVDSDYRVEDKKDFDSQDTKIDEDKSFNIKPGETVTKEMRPILITLANDGKSVTVKGGNSKTFPITGNYKELYFFADVEVPKGDKDISSSSNSTEYGVVRITTKVPNYPPKGFVDGYSCSGFNGWASDANTSNPIFVDVYVADQNNTNRRLLTRLTANQPRSDVGNHGWYLSVPQNLKDGLPHFFQFFAINHPEGNNLLLAHNSNPNLTTFQLICAPAFGSTKPTYRFYNPDYAFRSHFFTIREAEKNQLLSTGWQAEGIGWYAYEQKEANTVPVYRFFHNRNGLGHFYTASQTEKDQLSNQAEWTYEGIAFYAYTYQHYGTVPVYRFYSNEKQSHFYTTSTWEKDNAPTWGYHYEGIAFYVLPMDYR